jgi:transposase
VQIRVTSSLINIFCEGQSIASHPKNNLPYKHTTLVEHMPKNHVAYLEWTPERIIKWAQKTGPHTAELIQHLMDSKEHPQQGFRASLGILRLGKRYGDTRLEKACQRALALGVYRYKNIESILRSGLDQVAIPQPTPHETRALLPDHNNIRGAHYYYSSGEIL